MVRQEASPVVNKDKGSFRSIFMHADATDKLLMTLGFLGSMVDGVSIPTVMFVFSKMINSVGGPISTETFQQKLYKYVAYLCYIAAAQGVTCFIAERQASRLRTSYLKAVLRQEVAYVDLYVTSTAELIASISSDSLVVQDFISEKAPLILFSVSRFIAVNVIAYAMFWRLAIVGFPLIALLIIPGLFCGRALMRIAINMRSEYNKAATIVEQAISSIRTVHSFAGEAKTSAEYSAALEGSFRLGLRQGLAKGLSIGTNGIIFAIWAFIAYYGSRLVMYHGANGGIVYTVGFLLVLGGMSLGTAFSNLKDLSEASVAAEHVMKIIKRVPKIDADNMKGQILDNISGEMEFKHVEFAYPSRPESKILKDFNLKIPAGKTIALVGGSGSGKSTAIALLQRFYDPLEGEILFDGVNINKLQLKWLRSQMGLVSQEPALFATTVKENILFGKENASLEEVIEAAKASNAHNFISQLPQGYDSQVGERGVQMSGGQKQRIAIARAIIKAPKILLLDEATSALDAESERVVQEALDSAAPGRTRVVIAHRLSTIRNVDLIAVVKNGQVIENGSHDELIQDEDGFYMSLVRLQQTDNSIPIADDIPETPVVPEAPVALPPQPSLRRSKRTSSSGRILSFTRIGSVRAASSSQRFKEENETVAEEEWLLVPSLKRPSFRRLLAMNSPEWRHATLGCFCAVIYGAIQPTYSFIMGSQISVYFNRDHREIKEKTKLHALLFVGLAMISFLVNLSQYYSFAAMGENLTKRIRERMVSKIFSFEIGWFDKDENATGVICSRLDTDAKAVRSVVGDRMLLLIHAISSVAISCTMGLIISWKLALVMITVQPLLILCIFLKMSLLKTMSKKAIKAQAESSKLAVEAVSNFRTVAAFSSQSRILQILEKAQEGPRRESIHQSWLAGIGLSSSSCLMTLTWALSFWYGGKLMADGHLDGKSLYQIFMILVGTGRVLADALTTTSDLERGSKAVESVFEILDRHPLIEPEDPDGHHPDKIAGDVELRDVYFTYPTRPKVMVFRGFSLKIEAGKSTALVGQSGSGKSTIISLIERFYDPLKGEVMIDGRDIKSYHLRRLRKHIGLVSQEPALFAATVRENITYGASKDTEESEIIAAAKAANAHDFISGLQSGYDTWCGDKGLQLSGGQKQRIAIARALLKNAAILLLDEATSALDSQSEKHVQDALERVMNGRTSVVVAHRLSTIQACDTIAVVEKGKIVEKGTHFSLLAAGQGGVYHSLVSLQTVPNTPLRSPSPLIQAGAAQHR